MMFLISYDLNKSGQNYDALYEHIKKAPDWCHLLESVWLISTNESLTQWREKLMKVMDKNDRLFIVDITRQSTEGWLIQETWDWINKHKN